MKTCQSKQALAEIRLCRQCHSCRELHYIYALSATASVIITVSHYVNNMTSSRKPEVNHNVSQRRRNW